MIPKPCKLVEGSIIWKQSFGEPQVSTAPHIGGILSKWCLYDFICVYLNLIVYQWLARENCPHCPFSVSLWFMRFHLWFCIIGFVGWWSCRLAGGGCKRWFWGFVDGPGTGRIGWVGSCWLPWRVLITHPRLEPILWVTASLVPACLGRLCPRGIFEAQKHGQPQDNRMLEG